MESRTCSTTKYIITIEKEILKSKAEYNVPTAGLKLLEPPNKAGVKFCDYIRNFCNSCNACQPRSDVDVQVQVHVQTEAVEGENIPVEETKIFRKSPKPKAKAEDYYVYYFK